MQYYPMFLPSPLFMSTIVAHFNRVCRHFTPLCIILPPLPCCLYFAHKYSPFEPQFGFVMPLAEPYSSCTQHLQPFSPYATCPPEMPSFCSACRRVPPAHPRDWLCHATGILCRVDADGLSALHLSMCFGTEFACISITWQANDSRMCEAEASDDDNDFIAAGSSCMWMPR